MPYSFVILRYVHDVLTEEFLNIGITLYCPELNFFQSKITNKVRRISEAFEGFNSSYFKKNVRNIESELNHLGQVLNKDQINLFKAPFNIEALFNKVLPVDDSSYQFSEAKTGITENPDATLRCLFDLYVEKYSVSLKRNSRLDDDIWNSFRKPFHNKKILDKLTVYEVKGKNYEYEFKHSWKNGKWNTYEPVSFDLIEGRSILDKAVGWAGKIYNLTDAGQDFKVHFLVGKPKNNSLFKYFDKAINILSDINCDHDIIEEEKAESFADNLAKEISKHEAQKKTM